VPFRVDQYNRPLLPARRFLAPVLVLNLYIGVSYRVATTRIPWSNEAWFANPAYTLAKAGYLGTPILESKGTWLRGIERHTYWILPVQPVLLGAWFWTFGFGLLQQQWFSIVSGAVAQAAAGAIAASVSRGLLAPPLAMAMVGLQPSFLDAAVNGRMEMLCLALGLTAYAAFFRLPPGHLWLAHTAAALSAFTHPCGVLFAAGLLLLSIWKKREALRPARLAVSAIPYLLLLGAWGGYIAQAPQDFRSQFLGNISGFAGEYSGRTRGSGMRHPFEAVRDEIVLRYLEPLGLGSGGHPARAIPFMLALLLIGGALVWPLLRAARVVPMLCSLWLLHVGILTFLEGMKFFEYLVYSTAILLLCAAIAGADWIGLRLPGWQLAALAMLVSVVSGCGIAVTAAGDDKVKQEWQPVLAYLSGLPPDTRIVAPAEFAYGLGFNGRFTDDVRLGYYSGREPDVVVAGSWYLDWIARAGERDPLLGEYLNRLLHERLKVGMRTGSYLVFVRRN
jgi:hypothetical protein